MNNVNSQKPLRFAVVGAGFWARFQLAAWRELERAGEPIECVAICDPARDRAEVLAREFGVARVDEDAATMLGEVRPDFVDIIAGVAAHAPLVQLCASHGVPVICQKPMAPTLAEAEAMVEACRAAGVGFWIHENWRWQRPLRELQSVLRRGDIGPVFRARLSFCTSFPVFDNQPFLKTEERFIVADIGSHVLDVARFLFGEARNLTCHTRRVNPDIRGEDVATVLMQMREASVVCEMSYASRLENERFPQTFALVEGERGSVELGVDYWLRVTTSGGTQARRVPPPRYAWADPAYDVVHASLVECCRDLLGAVRGRGGETSGADNLQTVRLVSACYDSARSGETVFWNDSTP